MSKTHHTKEVNSITLQVCLLHRIPSDLNMILFCFDYFCFDFEVCFDFGGVVALITVQTLLSFATI